MKIIIQGKHLRLSQGLKSYAQAHVIAPLNRVGDLHGTPFRDGKVTTPPGWKDAFKFAIEKGDSYGTDQQIPASDKEPVLRGIDRNLHHWCGRWQRNQRGHPNQ